MRVLIADDSRVERWRLQQILQEAGHEVVHCSPDAQDALKHIRLLKPDLAVVDVVMPQMTGDQLAQELLKDEWRPRMVFATKNSQQALKDIVKQVGGALCVKPYSAELLLLAIERVNGKY